MAYRSNFNRGFRDRDAPRKMHKVKCSKCGKDAEVPFKPSGDRPVFCRDCYLKSKGITPRKEFSDKKSEKAEEDEEEEEAEEESEEDEE